MIREIDKVNRQIHVILKKTSNLLLELAFHPDKEKVPEMLESIEKHLQNISKWVSEVISLNQKNNV